jgi:Holliday junction resolvase RusA-like endonuclease
MPKIEFTVPGVPRGKGRPRTAIRGKFAQLYTDDKTVAYENRILLFFKQAAPGHQPIPKGVAIIVSIEALFPIPASYSKKRKQEAYEYLGKPDSDNMIKCLDALNSVAWVDDSQIWRVDLEKRYTNAEPGLTITIMWAIPPRQGTSGTLARTAACADLDSQYRVNLLNQ